MSFNFANYSRLYIPEGQVKTITRKSDGLVLWSKKYVNQVLCSTETNGQIYNNGLGYKDGYRVRSGGTEIETARGTCTGFIPVKGGDVIRISGCTFSVTENENAINVSNSSFENIGQACMIGYSYGIFADEYKDYNHKSVVQEKTGVWKWIVPPAASGVAYIRVNGSYGINGTFPGANLIVTINEEIV